MEIKKHLPLLGLGGLLILLVGIIGILDNGNTLDFSQGVGSKEGECNVSGITLYGILTTYTNSNINSEEDGEELAQTSSDYIQDRIEQGENDKAIKAIVLEIDSWGGHPVAGEEVANALKRAQKPTVALIRGTGTSAAYWAATGADSIYASQNSDVGGIGVSMSYLGNAEKNSKEGLTYYEVASAPFKDYGNPDKPLTTEERELFLRDIQVVHDNFVGAVAENRNLDINKVKVLADGSSTPGQMALANGLIDKIGGIYEVVEYLEEKTGEAVNICWQ